LNKISHIGKRTFKLATCGPLVFPIDYHIDAIPYTAYPEENNAPESKRFKPNLEHCRSRLSSEAEDIKYPENEKDIASILLQKLKCTNQPFEEEREDDREETSIFLDRSVKLQDLPIIA